MDKTIAVEWYRKAAEQGYADGQCCLGFMYENGQGTEQNYEKAIEWYRKAAEQGHAQAQYNLGRMYLNGLGTDQDYTKAAEWYQKAAEQGDVDAYNQVAWTYHLMGKYEEALPWAEKAVAASPDNPGIIDTLATVYQGLGRFDEALEQFELCLKLKKEQGANEDSIHETEEKIEELKKQLNKKL
jgi:TPR repeat protein